MKTLVGLVVLFFTLGHSIHGQDAIENVRLAFDAGSAKELVRYFNNITEVKINEVGGNYSVAQAEPLMRDFFQQNLPTTFTYIHKGQSPQGLKYNIGQYKSGDKSYRVVILMKQVNGYYVIDTMNLTEE